MRRPSFYLTRWEMRLAGTIRAGSIVQRPAYPDLEHEAHRLQEINKMQLTAEHEAHRQAMTRRIDELARRQAALEDAVRNLASLPQLPMTAEEVRARQAEVRSILESLGIGP